MPAPTSPAPLVYLKPEVKIEPLACRWHAWPHLIAPAQLAMHLAERILPLLRSFADNPSVHVAANSDPTMYGGPFVSLALDQVDAVRQLIADTERNGAALIALAGDYRALDETLQERATGYSLNEFYASLPPSLAGLVELLYDGHHRPSIRVFESLLHARKLGAPLQQIMLNPVADGEREFFMSTPRLDRPGSLLLDIGYADPRLDLLAAARSRPCSPAELARELDIDERDLPAFRAMFTAKAPAPAGEASYAGDGVRMRYFGHACVLFQTARTNVLFDPFFSVEPGDDGRLTFNDLPDFIDYVVITHAHQDHFSPEMLIQLRHRVGRVLVPANNSGNLSDPSMKLILQGLGFTRIDVLDALDRVAIPGGEIVSLPFTGEHADLSIYSKQAIALKAGGRQFLFLIDSDGRDPVLYQNIMREIGPVDALFIGMECQGAPLNWLYEPLLGQPVNRRNNESRRLSGANAKRAWKVLGEIGAPRVFVYAMGQEPWMKYVMGLQYEPDSIQLTESAMFIERCERAGIAAERLYLSRELCWEQSDRPH